MQFHPGRVRAGAGVADTACVAKAESGAIRQVDPSSNNPSVRILLIFLL